MTSRAGRTSRDPRPEPAESTYRLLLSLYPSRWQERHADEALALLVDRSAQRTRPRIGDVVDLVWHALTARLDTAASPVLDRLPRSVRALPAIIALTIGAIASVIMLSGEISGALERPPHLDPMTFMTGPFQTIGVGIDIGFLLGVILVLAGRAGGARLIFLATTIYAVWLTWPYGLMGYPQPPEFVTGGMALIGVITILALGDDRLTGRDRWIVTLASVVGSSAALGAIFATTGSIGWSHQEIYRVPSTGFVAVGGFFIALAAVAVPLLVISIVIVVSAIRHRSYGALVLLMLFVQLVTLLHAVAATMDSDSATAWLWPIGCFVLLAIMTRLLRPTAASLVTPS